LHLISPRYAFISAYLRGKESRGIGALHLDGMLQKSTLRDALEVIRNTDVGDYLSKKRTKTFKEIDHCLWRYLGDDLKRIKQLNPPFDILLLTDQYLRKYDVLNIKIALRSVFMEKKAPMVPLGLMDHLGLLEELSIAKSIDEIAHVLLKCDLGDYASSLRNIHGKDGASRLQSETDLDRLYYRSMVSAMTCMDDGGLLTQALGIMIDLTNLQAVFRSVIGEKGFSGEFVMEGGHRLSVGAIKEFLSLKLSEIVRRLEHTEYDPCAQEIYKNYEMGKNITIVEKAIEKHKFQLLREILLPRVLSPTNLLWHLILKETEIRNVRLLLKTLADGMSTSEIKDYLVIGP
jgi:V/A-type H+-transporting ATPase subunit C